MEKAFKYRIYPNKKQIALIQQTFGCCRFVYNYYLDKRIKKYEDNKETYTYNQCANDLTQLKKQFVWLKDTESTALQSSLRDLDFAYKKFFKEHTGFPKFKSKKNNHKSYKSKCTNNNISFCDKKIKLPKLGYVKTKNKLMLQGRILNATISQEPSGKYYCSLCCTDVEINQLHKTNQSVGIDLGITDFAVLSNGDKISNPKYLNNSLKKLIKLQKELSRKTIGSANRNKVRIKVAKLQEHITNQRKDFLQKKSTNIIKQYDNICIEDLDVKEMKESDSTTRNRNVADVSWSEFRRLLTYKCEWYSKKLIVVDKYYASSQICHICGHNTGKKDVAIREFICPYCGTKHDRDINASINILNEGIRMLIA